MTEKRFTLHKGLDTLNIMDNTPYNEHIYINKSSRDMALVVEVLNMLHEENTEFRTALKELKEIGDYQAHRIEELTNENMKLEEQLRNLRRLANELYMEGSE